MNDAIEGPENEDLDPPGELVAVLREASGRGWTGLVNVAVDGKSMGSVVMQKGCVAWAVCRGQTNTLAELLGRIGLLGSADVQRAQEEYLKHGGKKKLGAIIEEQGLIQRPVLRRCLLLHARSAIEGLLELEGAKARRADLNFEADERIVFDLEELLPYRGGAENGRNKNGFWKKKPEWYRGNEDNEPLAFLKDVIGYQAAAVISATGEVLTAHCAQKEVDPVLIGIYLTSILDTSSRTISPNPLANVRFILLECDDETLISSWIDERKTHIIAVLLENGRGVGMAKYLIEGKMEELKPWLEERLAAQPTRGGSCSPKGNK